MSTIHNWVRDRQLPARKTMGRHMRFDPRLVVAYLERMDIDVPPNLRAFAEQPDLANATPPLPLDTKASG